MFDEPRQWTHAQAAIEAGESERAAGLYLDAADEWQARNPRWVVISLLRAAGCWLELGRHRSALDILDAPPAELDRYRNHQADWYLYRAGACTQASDYPAAERDIDRAHELADGHDPVTVAHCQARLAFLDKQRGHYGAALAGLASAREIYDREAPRQRPDAVEERKLKTLAAGCLLNLGGVWHDIGADDSARTAFGRALERYTELGDERLVAQTMVRIAGLSSGSGAHERARAELHQALGQFERTGDERAAADARLRIGVEWLLEEDPASAAAYFTAAMATFSAWGLRRQAAGCRLNLGHAARQRGDRYVAREHYESARTEFGRAGAPEWKARATVAIANLAIDSGAAAVALDLLPPAVLALDAKRFEFASATHRATWSRVFADATALTFGLAAQLARADLVAELVETTINSGVYTARRIGGLAGALVDDGEADRRTAPSPVNAIRLVPGAVLPVGAPPALRMADRRVALAASYAAAEREYETGPRPSTAVSVV